MIKINPSLGKHIILLILISLFTVNLSAQAKKNSISLNLQKVMTDKTYINAKNVSGNIPVLIRGDVESVEQFILQNNGFIKFKTKNIISASVSENTVQLLNEKDFVYWIDCPTGKIVPLNDLMVKYNNVDSAYNGIFPLDKSYDGTGVIIGIIDAPFDYRHEDLTDASGNTRIKYLWDQNNNGTYPASFDYGNECDSTEIANGTCAHEDVDYYYSHGTGVAGTAASSGNANISNIYRGVAPNAELILVAINFENNFLTNTVDAIAYIFEKADAAGKPCVINTSFGSYVGSHDGMDITSQSIVELLNESSGRVVVAAAGNAGNAKIHLSYDVTPTPQFTWFKKLSYLNAIYFQIWADSAEFDDVNFSIAADDPADYSFKGTSPAYNILSDYALDDGSIGSTFNEVYDGATLTGTVETAAQKIDGRYFLEVYVVPVNPAYYWRFSTSGTGSFDIWSTESFTGYSNFATILPDAATFPEIVNYQMPNTDQTIVSNWQCLDEVITVGSYVNRDTMTNYYGVYPTLIDTVGQLFYSSSHGPTRDGRIKPDITATGARVLSSASQTLTDWFLSFGGGGDYISEDGKHYLFNGTSFASPVVTGIAALYLQKNPNAGYAEVKDAILSAAKHDTFTGDILPDNRWGYGKADAFRTLTGPWGCSEDDHENAPGGLEITTVSSNAAYAQWDIIANAERYQVMFLNLTTSEISKTGTAKTHRILKTLSPSTDYLCRVRAMCETYGYSDWSEPVYFTTLPLKEGAGDEVFIQVFPNPANNYLNVDGLTEGTYEITFYNMLGASVLQTVFLSDEQIATIDISTLQNGIYTIAIKNNTVITTKQIVVSR
ncbi:MAG: S8 family serine peptidase [Fimbriimonadaceae bacterium]|nr:S8 family serine peptidase [Chitinophagales bacterium]